MVMVALVINAQVEQIDFCLRSGELTRAQCSMQGTLIYSPIHRLLPSLRQLFGLIYVPAEM